MCWLLCVVCCLLFGVVFLFLVSRCVIRVVRCLLCVVCRFSLLFVVCLLFLFGLCCLLSGWCFAVCFVWFVVCCLLCVG